MGYKKLYKHYPVSKSASSILHGFFLEFSPWALMLNSDLEVCTKKKKPRPAIFSLCYFDQTVFFFLANNRKITRTEIGTRVVVLLL